MTPSTRPELTEEQKKARQVQEQEFNDIKVLFTQMWCKNMTAQWFMKFWFDKILELQQVVIQKDSDIAWLNVDIVWLKSKIKELWWTVE